ncbi:MAG: diguanylate cyclase, partial [Lachnospiraceae bacterium]|nr:diguanylate cyclase [Lachnospiraceae bacterium]
MEVFVGVCVAIILLLLFTKAIPTRRRKILMSIEISAFLLLFFDRLAYEYSGNITRTGYIMVRLSNFIVFFMSVFIVFVFNIYLFDLLRKEGGLTTFPNRLKVAGIVSVIGMILIIVSQFTGLYYTFDESNVYHRSPAFIVCFIFPFIASMLQLTVAYVYRKQFGKWIYISLVLFMTMPFIAGIIQVFTYGLSPVNITIAIVAMFLYIFAHLHINEEMEKSHNARIRDLEEEKKNIRDIFDKTVKSFVNALDGRYVHTRGHSQRVADYARRIAEMDGKSSDECDD